MAKIYAAFKRKKSAAAASCRGGESFAHEKRAAKGRRAFSYVCMFSVERVCLFLQHAYGSMRRSCRCILHSRLFCALYRDAGRSAKRRQARPLQSK